MPTNSIAQFLDVGGRVGINVKLTDSSIGQRHRHLHLIVALQISSLVVTVHSLASLLK